nr:hypothetical protein [Tanacetum cinerariifolium]
MEDSNLNEHYALWEAIEFGDSYKVPPEETGKGPTSESSARKKGRTVAITTKDMQKRRNDVKARTTLLWVMYTIVWRKRDGLDTMSLDDVYNHLKVYELEVQKKSESNSQNMAFISSSNTSSGKGEVHTASVPTASTQVSTTSTDVAAASLSHDTICAYIATQSNGSQRSDKNKEGLGYSAVPTPPAQIYSPPKKDLSWTGLPEFVDDTVTDYSRPTPSIDASKCNKSEIQSSNFLFLSMENQQETKEKLLRPQLVRFGDLNKILLTKGNLRNNNDDKGYWDSGCSRHMTGNISYLSEYEPYDGGYVSFRH